MELQPQGLLDPDLNKRLKNLQELYSLAVSSGNTPQKSIEVNTHVHTRYSFSPYYPAGAAWMAWKAGLQAVGIMDHDSISGAEELVSACKILNIASTAGCEIRVNTIGTRLEGRRINNPDSESILYMAVHGIAERFFSETKDFLKPIQKARQERNRRQIERLNRILENTGLAVLDYEKDVESVSLAPEGGEVTERHILYALSLSALQQWGKGAGLPAGLKTIPGLTLDRMQEDRLSDPENPHLPYDLLGIFKAEFLPSFFIQPDYNECIGIKKAVDFSRQIHAIPAYAYLGDIEESVTGDKKAEKFEDSYLDFLFEEILKIGFKAVTYMPPRNTLHQIKRVRELCRKSLLMEISGVDINSSRQSFNCPEVLRADFNRLIDSAWALIAHEKLVNLDESWDLFGDGSRTAQFSLDKRIDMYQHSAKSIDWPTLTIREMPADRMKT